MDGMDGAIERNKITVVDELILDDKLGFDRGRFVRQRKCDSLFVNDHVQRMTWQRCFQSILIP